MSLCSVRIESDLFFFFHALQNSSRRAISPSCPQKRLVPKFFTPLRHQYSATFVLSGIKRDLGRAKTLYSGCSGAHKVSAPSSCCVKVQFDLRVEYDNRGLYPL